MIFFTTEYHRTRRFWKQDTKFSLNARVFSCNFVAENMSYAHLIFGIIVFVVFLVTGKFMRVDFPDKEIIPQEFRLLMRSRHIYILFSGLIHLSLGAYLQIRPQKWRRVLQYFGSFLLVVSSGLLLWGFIFETYVTQHFSDISRNGIYTSLAGIGFHLIGGLNVSHAGRNTR